MDTAVRPDQAELRVRALARDGWTYAGMSAGMLLLAAVGMVLANKYRGQFDEIAMFIGVGLTSSAVCGLVSIVKLWRAGTLARLARWLAVQAWRLRYPILLLIICAIAFATFGGALVRVTALALPAAVFIPFGILLLLQWWKRTAFSRTVFVLTGCLVLPLVYLFGCTIEFVAAAYYETVVMIPDGDISQYELVKRAMPYCRTLPEGARDLIWQESGASSSSNRILYYCGFPPVSALRSTALNPKDACHDAAVVAWALYAPQAALAYAETIPETSTPTISATNNDHAAGLIIGCAGSPEIVRARLTGSYSLQLLESMERALHEHKRAAGFSSFAVDALRRGANVPTLWRIASQGDPAPVRELALELLATNDPASQARLLMGIPTLARYPELLLEIIKSSNPTVRSRCYPWRSNRKDPRWMRHLINAAQGKLPNADVLERREALQALVSTLEMPSRFFYSGMKPLPAPLSQAEETAAEKIVQRAQARLDKMDQLKK